MALSISRGAVLCLLLLCAVQVPVGAQLAPQPLPKELAFSSATNTALWTAVDPAAERPMAYTARQREAAFEAARFIGETAFGAVGSLGGWFLGMTTTATALDMLDMGMACPGDEWFCDDLYVALISGAVGSVLGSGLMARFGNDVLGGHSSLRGSVIGGLAGMVVGWVLAVRLASDPTVDERAPVVVYTVTQGALAAAGGRLFQRDP